MHVITLTTDFGTRDWFVGTMKGVILNIQPRATVVDLTHEIPPGDVRAGAFALMAGCRFFPQGTVHVAVVDPGVGGARRTIAVQTENHFFVGPDNGVLSFALARKKIKAIHQLTNEKLFLKPVSHTFHGRDVFAPVAAQLSRGVPIQKLGPSLDAFVRLEWPQLRILHSGIKGEVVHLDRFGNAITNIPVGVQASACSQRSKLKLELQLADSPARVPTWDSWTVFVKGKPICLVSPFYQSVPRGRTVAVPGSSGFLEIAVNGGSAERKLGLKIGDRVDLQT